MAIDSRIIGDIVAEVGHRRRENRREPDRIHSQPLQVIECGAVIPSRSPMPSPLPSRNERGYI